MGTTFSKIFSKTFSEISPQNFGLEAHYFLDGRTGFGIFSVLGIFWHFQNFFPNSVQNFFRIFPSILGRNKDFAKNDLSEGGGGSPLFKCLGIIFFWDLQRNRKR